MFHMKFGSIITLWLAELVDGGSNKFEKIILILTFCLATLGGAVLGKLFGIFNITVSVIASIIFIDLIFISFQVFSSKNGK